MVPLTKVSSWVPIVDPQRFAGESKVSACEAELLLPAFLRAQVVSLEKEQAPAPPLGLDDWGVFLLEGYPSFGDG